MQENRARTPVVELLDGDIKKMREAGYTLSQIAQRGGVTRERIRQVINEFYPGTKPKTLTELQVAKKLGVPSRIIKDLRIKGVIQPIIIGDSYRYNGRILRKIITALTRSCKICGNPVPRGNIKYCENCSIKMRNPRLRRLFPDEQQKQKESQKRWVLKNKEHEKIRMDTYNSKLSLINYEKSVYQVKLTSPGFKIGERFKAIGCRDNKLILADGRTIQIGALVKILGRRNKIRDQGKME
jgi:hypothetical protein